MKDPAEKTDEHVAKIRAGFIGGRLSFTPNEVSSLLAAIDERDRRIARLAEHRAAVVAAWDGTAGGEPVRVWKDESGYGRDMVQDDPAKQPRRKP